MTFRTRLAMLPVCLLFCAPLLRGQARAAASRSLDLSAFVGSSATNTGLHGGRNLGLTAGVSFTLPLLYGFVPSIELRGTKPLDEGQVISESSAAAGLQFGKPMRRTLPFANILVGRGQFEYLNGGLAVPNSNVVYTKSASNLISPGFGVLVDIDSHFSIRADAQFQYFKTPVTTSGHFISTSVTIGLVYHLPSTQHGHPYPSSF